MSVKIRVYTIVKQLYSNKDVKKKKRSGYAESAKIPEGQWKVSCRILYLSLILRTSRKQGIKREPGEEG